MRIYHQSFLDPDVHAPYFARLRTRLAEIADPGTVFEVGGVRPPDTALSRLSEFRCAVSAVENVIDAAERGFDAAVIGHFQDSGLYEARSAVDIPVLGLGEASMLYAAQLGRGFGLVTIDDVFVGWHAQQAEAYGLRDRLVGVTSMRTPPEQLVAAFEDDEAAAAVREAFMASARPLVGRGAEVVMSAGGLFALLGADQAVSHVDGAVVLNPLSLTAKLAEVAVKLDLRPSRVSTFALAPRQAIEEFRTMARGGVVR